LYAAHPLNSTAPDYGPLAVALAGKPEGPWVPWRGNPVLPGDSLGTWDDGGYSEAKVFLWHGTFHVFYGGAKQYEPRMQTRESIGYAYSLDGFHFRQYGANPVAVREENPNAAAFAEVHALPEPPFIYVFHTLRYVDPLRAPRRAGRTSVQEDLGVQVLVGQSPFCLPLPALVREELAPGAATDPNDCPPIALGACKQASVTVACEHPAGARSGVRVHVRSSPDGLQYDTADVASWNGDFRPGALAQKTVELPGGLRYVKIFVENLDKNTPCRKLRVTVTLRG
jgi:hypothetical protein